MLLEKRKNVAVGKQMAVAVFVLLALTGCHALQGSDGESLPDTDCETTEETDSVESPETATEPAETEESAEATKPVAPKEYLTTPSGQYVYSGRLSEGLGPSHSGDYRYKDYHELKFLSLLDLQNHADDTKSPNKTFSLFGADIPLTLVTSMRGSGDFAELPLVEKFGNYDVYQDQDGNRYYLRASDSALLKYRAGRDGKTSADGNCSPERAIQIANDFVGQILGEAAMGGYTVCESPKVMFDKYWVSYDKHLHGYRTTDEITVCVNMDGSIDSYTGLYVSLYDEVASRLTEDVIEAAEEDLLSALASNQIVHLRVGAKNLEIDIHGNIYLTLYAEHGDQGQYYDVFFMEVPWS